MEAIQLVQRMTEEDKTPMEDGVVQLVELAPLLPRVDDWECPPELQLYRHIDKAIVIPVSRMFGIYDPNNSINFFDVSPKRCYNRPEMRIHTTKYLNYFNNFFDKEGELYMMYGKIKYMIDEVPPEQYPMELFIKDLKRYILFNKSILWKVYCMNEANYMIELKAKKGRSVPSLQYNVSHGKILMQMSLLMNMVIPLVTLYAKKRNLEPIDDVLLSVFDIILYMSDADIYSKLFETTSSEVERSNKLHKVLWDMQSIRGINAITHTEDSIVNIILNIIPKYEYKENIISFNCTSIRNSNKFKVTGIKYEYNFNKLSSSNRDADCQSDFDKYESYMIKQNEALFLQNKVNCEYTMLNIDQLYGPFPQDEIDYYKVRLASEAENGTILNPFQMELIFNLFYKYFGDPKSINSINADQYVVLMIAAYKILLANGLTVLPYVISSKVVKMPSKKAMNKKLIQMITLDSTWEKIKEKYHNDQIILNDILEKIGVAISSEYKIISVREPELDGKVIDYGCATFIAKEFMDYILMI